MIYATIFRSNFFRVRCAFSHEKDERERERREKKSLKPHYLYH